MSVVGNDATAPAGKKRHQYSANFEAEVINMMKQPGKKQESVADHFRIDQSLVSMYLKNKIQIAKGATDDYQEKLFKRQKCETFKIFIQHFVRSLKKQELEAIL